MFCCLHSFALLRESKQDSRQNITLRSDVQIRVRIGVVKKGSIGSRDINVSSM